MKLKMALIRWLESVWYGERGLTAYLLAPLSLLFCTLAKWRRKRLQAQAVPSSVPVIVVGNITVGGTGKTPLILHLTQCLQQAGYRVGIVSRGYGASSASAVQTVTVNSTPQAVGDEALLLAWRSKVPVVVGRDRPAAIQYLLAQQPCDVVLSDDGLQHYRMARAVEIAVVDGVRRLGNGLCLPAGPLREPVWRLKQCDMIVSNGAAQAGEYAMQVSGDTLHALQTEQSLALQALAGQTVHVMTAIGHPERFFATLRQAGLQIIPHVFPDHYLFNAADIKFADDYAVVMTEKDAVKCRTVLEDEDTPKHDYWFLPVSAQLAPAFDQAVLQRMKELIANG